MNPLCESDEAPLGLYWHLSTSKRGFVRRSIIIGVLAFHIGFGNKFVSALSPGQSLLRKAAQLQVVFVSKAKGVDNSTIFIVNKGLYLQVVIYKSQYYSIHGRKFGSL